MKHNGKAVCVSTSTYESVVFYHCDKTSCLSSDLRSLCLCQAFGQEHVSSFQQILVCCAQLWLKSSLKTQTHEFSDCQRGRREEASVVSNSQIRFDSELRAVVAGRVLFVRCVYVSVCLRARDGRVWWTTDRGKGGNDISQWGVEAGPHR